MSSVLEHIEANPQETKRLIGLDFSEMSNVVVLDPDVAEIFRDSASVNEVLRSPDGVTTMPNLLLRKGSTPQAWKRCNRKTGSVNDIFNSIQQIEN